MADTAPPPPTPPRPVAIKAMLDLMPVEAVRFLAAKGYRPTVDWTEMMHEEHTANFTVAKMAKLDMLRSVHESLVTALADGTPYEQWAQDLQPELERAGWWGAVRDPELTGTGETVRIGPRRLRIIFDTNLRMARSTALWARIQANKAALPYLRYSAVLDRRTRPLHRHWHGTVLPVDDPWWQTHFPPNSWNCRCTVVQMNDRMLAARGLTVGPAPDDGSDIPFMRRGDRRAIMVPRGIDPGFGYNPGAARLAAVAAKAAAALAAAPAQGLALDGAAVADLLAGVPAGRLTPDILDAIVRMIAGGEAEALAALIGELLG